MKCYITNVHSWMPFIKDLFHAQWYGIDAVYTNHDKDAGGWNSDPTSK